MRGAVIQLESFSAQPVVTKTDTFGHDDIQQAYGDGYEAGHAAGRDADLAQLASDLRAFATTLAAGDELAARLRRESIDEMRPLFDAIIDTLGIGAANARLKQALSGHLAVIGDTAPIRRPLIRHAPAHHQPLTQALEAAGLTGLRLEEAEGDTTEIIFETGSVQFDPLRVMAEVKAILTDFLEEDPDWQT